MGRYRLWGSEYEIHIALLSFMRTTKPLLQLYEGNVKAFMLISEGNIYAYSEGNALFSE